VDFDNAENVAQVRKVFAAASGYRMPIVVHMHASIDMKRKYGADQARVFINELLPAAADVPVQIAHLAGAGGYDDVTDSALGVFTNAMAKHARMKNVWFDASAVAQPDMPTPELQRIAGRIRQIGVDRVLFGSDAATSAQAYPKAAWETFQRLPLTSAELRIIAGNVAPYM
jgi:predicted TIM-barrel fold metal-dependent hydrolase